MHGIVYFMKNIETEVCVTSVAGAIHAQNVCADRVEVCTALQVGGLTPSAGLIEGVRRAFDGEVVVLVRPRPGDFAVTSAELGTMCQEIEHARDLGADGVAVGALTPQGQVDEAAMAALVASASSLNVTFHRAIDSVKDPCEALGVLRGLGVARVLTSGGEKTAMEGIDGLAQLVAAAGDTPCIVAAAGIRSKNVRELIRRSGVSQVHFSASQGVKTTMNESVPWVLSEDRATMDHVDADPEELIAMMAQLR